MDITPDTNIPRVYEVLVKVPFSTKREAEIAYDVLRIDEEPKRSGVTKKLTLEESSLSAHFKGDKSKQVRASMTAFYDNIILITETFDKFAPPQSEKYDFY